MQKIMLWVFMAIALTLSGVAQASVDKRLYIYNVHKVAANDSLNLRALPGVEGKVLATIPYNSKGVVSTGRSRQLGRSVWLEVHWAGKLGWVNKYYLKPEVQTASTKPAKNSDKDTKTNVKKTQDKKKGSAVYMQCNGNEPFWTIKITEQKMNVHVMDAEKYQVAVDLRKQSANNTSIAVVAGRRGNAFTSAFLQKVEICSDGMSDKNYPYSVTALLNGRRVVSGCCSIVGAQ